MRQMGKKPGIFVFWSVLLLAVLLLPGGMTVQAKKLKLNKTKVYLAKKDTVQLKVTGIKANRVKWSSNKKSVAAVTKKGLVKAKKIGKATITAKAGSKKLKCTVIVETKTVNRARILRDYVLKKGKKDKETGLITLEKATYDEGTGKSYDYAVGASKKNKMMTFTYSYAPEYPYDRDRVEMTIDLISGKAKVKKGTVSYRYSNNDEPFDYRYEGVILSQFDADDEYPVHITKYGYLGTDESGTDEMKYEEADRGSHTDENETLNYRTDWAFKAWDEWFKSIKGLKKYGISMKAIGFEW